MLDHKANLWTFQIFEIEHVPGDSTTSIETKHAKCQYV